LVVDNVDYADNGADFFINAGSQFLDRLDEVRQSESSIFKFLDVGKWSISLPYCRAIKKVWCASSSERWELKKRSFSEMRGLLTDLPSARQVGLPTYYSPCILRHVSESGAANAMEAFSGFVEVPSGSKSNCNALIVSVPANERLMLEVNGLFYSPTLVEDTDSNLWSDLYPHLLVMSAIRYAEIFHRNREGAKAWEEAIIVDMQQLGFDLVEEQIAGVNEMRDFNEEDYSNIG